MSALKPLRCPECGAQINPTLEYQGLPYLQERVVVGFECSEWECGAAWDRNGDPRAS